MDHVQLAAIATADRCGVWQSRFGGFGKIRGKKYVFQGNPGVT
jgi:hypothetical protein